MGTVSFRDHIRWDSEFPSEPTSTVVLTSPGRYFVDIRVLNEALPSPDDEAPTASVSPRLSIEHLDWAIGGTSSSENKTRPDGTPFSHSVFTHWVDSRTRHPETATDEGDMFLQPDGTTLETGRMVNPATGEESAYEELWRDGQPEYPSALPKCMVLKLHDDAQATRGLFVQLGQHAQGVLRVGDIFTAERWLWDSTAAKWDKVFMVGDEGAQSLDDIIPATQKRLLKGDSFQAGSGNWAVVEVDA